MWKFFRRKKSRPRTIVLRPMGMYYNLQEIYESLNHRYFEGQLQLRITWFGSKKTDYRRRVILGSYHQRHELIRINRVLDEADIPVYYLSFIVYHEMLHHVLPPIIQQRRRQIHHAAFKERERQFHDYALAREYREKTKMKWFVT